VKLDRRIDSVHYIVYFKVPTLEREIKPKGHFLASVKRVLVFERFGSHSFLVVSHIACFPHELHGQWFPTEYAVHG
jgi:hypothetical protein